MKTRTDEELNAIIHKWMKADEPPQPEILLLNTGDGRSYLKDERPPNYCGDLNAVHEAENQIFELQQAWENYVRHITDTCVEPADALHATARQRADALARVIDGGNKHE